MDEQAARLLTAVNAAARQPDFYGDEKIPDTLDGRLEALYLHAALALHRLKTEPEARPLAQAFTDRFFRNLDEGLREAGVGDLSVPRQMQKLARSFYGRVEAYAEAVEARDEAAMAAALARNMFGAESAPPYASSLARYALEAAARLAASPVDKLDRLDVWAVAAG
ncbi:MAG: ubiquinol-cytochrome C chaperone family protein [Hyphomonadaceae bacterium]